MPSKLQDNANYIATFLGAIVGLTFFRDQLTAYKLSIAWMDISIFNLLALFIVLLALASYLNALAVQSENLNITRFRLTLWLWRVAKWISVFALVMPVAVAVAVSATFLISSISHFFKIHQDIISNFLLIVTSLIAAIFAKVIQYKSESEDRQLYAYETLHRIESEKINRNEKNVSTQNQALYTYKLMERVTDYAKSYLQSEGYGIRSDSLAFIARVLEQKGLIDHTLSHKLKTIWRNRSQLLDGNNQISRDELNDAISALELLTKKILFLFEESESQRIMRLKNDD